MEAGRHRASARIIPPAGKNGPGARAGPPFGLYFEGIMAALETVTVKREGGKGYRIINKSDFDPAKHELLLDAYVAAQQMGQDALHAAPAAAEAAAGDIGAESGADFSDSQLRAMIEDQTGKRPGGRTSRDNLIAQFNALNGSE